MVSIRLSLRAVDRLRIPGNRAQVVLRGLNDSLQMSLPAFVERIPILVCAAPLEGEPGMQICRCVNLQPLRARLCDAKQLPGGHRRRG